MQEEDDEEEEGDEIGELSTVTDGFNKIHMDDDVAPTNVAGLDDYEPANHQFHVPKPPLQAKQSQATKYDPASWDEYFDSTDKIDGRVPCYYAGNSGHVFLCLHGAGHSALSFAALAKTLKQAPYNSTCVSFDFRGHGGHYCEGETQLTQANLIEETIRAIKHVCDRYPAQSIILVGHSMGGSIATKTVDFI